MTCSHGLIIREVEEHAPADLLGAPVASEPCGHVVVERGAGSDLAFLGPRPSRPGDLVGAPGPVDAVMRVGVSPKLAADGRGASPQPACDGAHALAGLHQVGDLDALVLAQMAPRARLPVSFWSHAASVPINQWPLVTPGRTGEPVAPHLARALGDADRVRGLREVHARLQQLRIAGSPCGLHVTQPFVHDPLELVAHRRNLRFLKVLRRPLELARSSPVYAVNRAMRQWCPRSCVDLSRHLLGASSGASHAIWPQTRPISVSLGTSNTQRSQDGGLFARESLRVASGRTQRWPDRSRQRRRLRRVRREDVLNGQVENAGDLERERQ